MNKFFTIAKKEFTKSIKKVSFWIFTFWIPLLYIIIFWVVYFSNMQREETLQQKNDIIKNIYVYDESWIIKDKDNKINKNIVLVNNYDSWYNQFLWKEENIFLHYKKDFLETKKVDLFVNSKDFDDFYSWLVNELTKSSILDKITEKDLSIAYISNFSTNVKKFQDWKEVPDIDNKTIVAWIWAMVFCFMRIFWNTYMLTSLSQEKENRTIEIILSTVNTFTFISWKIFWWMLVLIFQMSILAIFPILSLFIFRNAIPDNIFEVIANISALEWISMAFYIIWGFLIFAWVMVAAGSLWANSKQAWNLSTPFILMSCLPLYLASSLMSNPQWTLALFFSYFPFTSPMLLLYRTWAWELQPIEKIIWPIIVIVYVIISFWIAKKVFEYGALEYSWKISFKSMFWKNKKVS